MSGSNPSLPPYTGPYSGSVPPRRFSYASVVQGSSNNTPNPATSSSRAPIPYTGSAGMPGSPYPPTHSVSSHSRRHSRAMDNDMFAGHLSSSWGRSGHAASYASAWHGQSSIGIASNGLDDPNAIAAAAAARLPPFFIPSYLVGTRQARRLEEAHNARLAAQRDMRSAHSSQAPSLSTSSSSVNVHKMVPSHRGMTHDIIERAVPISAHSPSSATTVASGTPVPALDDTQVAPLPSKLWVSHETQGIELSNSSPSTSSSLYPTEARYTGSPKQHDEASVIRSDVSIPRECGIYYYEVTVTTKQKDGNVQMCVGFTTPKVTTRRMPGWEPDSIGYAADDGSLLMGNSNNPRKYAGSWGNGDVVGAGVDFRSGMVFFTRNGIRLDNVPNNMRNDRLYPVVGVKKAGDHVRFNFGQSQFVFDINSLVDIERESIKKDMASTPVGSLCPPLTETELIHKLIAQYLAHDGYIETARAFAREVRDEHSNLAIETSGPSSGQDLEPEEDIDAIHRQKIRSAILAGEIDRALKFANAFYPHLLEHHVDIAFKLKCRKFIEMIRKCAELADAEADADASPNLNPRSKARTADDDFNGVFSHDMEMDDAPPLSTRSTNGTSSSKAPRWLDSPNGNGAMETSTDSFSNQTPVTSIEMTNRVVVYGAELKAEFDSETKASRDMRKALEDTLALVAYEDPRQGPLGHLLEEGGRAGLAEEVNRVILVSLGKSSSSAIETLFAQTDVLLDTIGRDGGPGAFIDLRANLSKGMSNLVYEKLKNRGWVYLGKDIGWIA